jgi:hypothetical protein
MTTILDTLRFIVLAVGATGVALSAAQAWLALVITAVSVAAIIGLYELSDRRK